MAYFTYCEFPIYITKGFCSILVNKINIYNNDNNLSILKFTMSLFTSHIIIYAMYSYQGKINSVYLCLAVSRCVKLSVYLSVWSLHCTTYFHIYTSFNILFITLLFFIIHTSTLKSHTICIWVKIQYDIDSCKIKYYYY